VNSIKNLRTFPWVRSLESANELQIHGWWFDMEHGALWRYNNNKKKFFPIKTAG
jgi:carbonic anhydrase